MTQLQNVSTTDLYYICQIVDTVTRNPSSYIRNIEDIFGDMASISLTHSFPKWTPFHIFIESVISSVIYEEAEKSKTIGTFWVDYLLDANDIKVSSASNDPHGGSLVYGYEYLEQLSQDNLINDVCENVTKQVFHVLFSNRATLAAFWDVVSWYVSDTARLFRPEAFTRSGHLKRSRIPMWAQNSIYHRDKGRCVLCKTDLTKLVTQENSLHFDHIIPLAKGGGNCVTNLQLTCSSCNTRKGGRASTTSKDYEAWYKYD
ncbi:MULTISPECIES: HNH endonuclease [Thalassospira]|uniref:HNH nuclease domain-containing protein n=1 Tax=Thalassospira tepidiphila TaxID=393657 RepID=A0ABX0X2J6_9PROT|nr:MULTISPECIES: HNH endonuclease [Thalassospira]NJB75672.1 hypothetical protein [Thalassospira tepidiphila]